jgi:nitroreductase
MPFKKLAKLARREKVIVLEEVEAGKLDKEETVLSVINDRRSVRMYSRRDVDDGKIIKLLEAASQAPSTGNYQPWEFVIVREKRMKEHLIESCYNQEWMQTAPVLLIVCTNYKVAGALYGERGLRLYGIQSTAAAIENILIAAESMGLSTCWVGAFSENIVSRIIECPEHVRPCAIITLGYAEYKPKKVPRQNLEDFVHNGTFGNSLKSVYVARQKKPTYVKFR